MNKAYTIILFLSGFLFLKAQTGINTDTPNAHTALDIQHTEDINNNTVLKGVSFPGVTLPERDNTANYNPATLPDGLLIYNTQSQRYNYFDASDSKWKSIFLTNPSQADIDCQNITVHGDYGTANALSAGNYLMVPVTVSEEGDYDIRGIAYQNGTGAPNGYYFHATGRFLTTGPTVIPVPAVGKPVRPTPSGQPDAIRIFLNGEETTCNPVAITVNDNNVIPDFTIEAGSVQAHGTYIGNQALRTSENFITLTLSVTNPAAAGATYHLSTNVVNGYSFVASGTLTMGDNNIVMRGRGVPGRNGNNLFTITSNSTATEQTTASVDVTVSSRTIRILTFGSNNYAIQNASNNGLRTYNLLNNPSFFGVNPESSQFPVNGFVIQRQSTNPNDITQSNIQSFNPDIIQIGYTAANSTEASRQLLADYVANGGVLLCFLEGSTNVNDLLKKIFNVTTNFSFSTTNSTRSGPLVSGTAIQTGPFGYGAFTQEITVDGTTNFAVTIDTNFPADAVVIANTQSTGGTVTTEARSLMHATKGFMLTGDGGTINQVLVSGTAPAVQPNSANAYFIMNTIAWAVELVNRDRPRGTESLFTSTAE